MRSSFLFEYIKNFRVVGAVAPSSRYLADKMLESIDFTNAKVIVEYGPGTGVFTSHLKKRMTAGTKLIAIEANDSFYRVLKDEYEGVADVEIVNDSAENVDAILKSHTMPSPDYIVSGLPFAALPIEVSESILESTKTLLGDEGTFITFQYTLLKREFFKSYFNDIRITREYCNLPPAYIFHCKNNKTP